MHVWFTSCGCTVETVSTDWPHSLSSWYDLTLILLARDKIFTDTSKHAAIQLQFDSIYHEIMCLSYTVIFLTNNCNQSIKWTFDWSPWKLPILYSS